jgi:putative ATP-dependent endonuclease of OLD family
MDETKRGTHTFYFKPKNAIRKNLFEATKSTPAEAKALAARLTIDDYETVWTGRAAADFNDDTVYGRLVGFPSKGIFSDPDKDDQALLGIPTNPIHREFACTFIRALRDVITELQSYRGNPLLVLLRGLESSVQIADATKIETAIATLNNDISSLPEIRDLAIGIQGALHQSVGHVFSPAISIESTLPNSIELLLKKLGILVGETDGSGYKGEMSEQSLGNANLIYLALKFLEYQRKLSSDRVAHFLLIEEPEAHLHAHVQRTLFSNLRGTQTQVIVSTHSTQVSSISRIKSVNVLAMRNGRSEVFQPANKLDNSTVARVERYLDAVRSTLLFAKGVILVEGEAELIMIPALVKGVFGIGVDELGVSIIAMNSAFFEHIGIIFGNDRIKRNCAIVTDFDRSLIDLPENPDDDTEEQKHFRAAEESGDQRKASLEAFGKDNIWLSVHFAEYTFEIDFLQANNAYEAAGTLTSIYTEKSHKAVSKNRLENEDISVAGKEILRLAKKMGKGWFALLLAEQVTVRTTIPDYILKALAFASQDIVKPETLKQMGLHRIFDKNAWEDLKNKFHETQDDLLKLPASAFITMYRGRAPDDALSHFCTYLDELFHASLCY